MRYGRHMVMQNFYMHDEPGSLGTQTYLHLIVRTGGVQHAVDIQEKTTIPIQFVMQNMYEIEIMCLSCIECMGIVVFSWIVDGVPLHGGNLHDMRLQTRLSRERKKKLLKELQVVNDVMNLLSCIKRDSKCMRKRTFFSHAKVELVMQTALFLKLYQHPSKPRHVCTGYHTNGDHQFHDHSVYDRVQKYYL